MNNRNKKMLRLKQRGFSYAQIGARYGITRQRVFQIVKRDKKKLTPYANRNPLKPTSEPQGRGLKRFCVELIGKVKNRLLRK